MCGFTVSVSVDVIDDDLSIVSNVIILIYILRLNMLIMCDNNNLITSYEVKSNNRQNISSSRKKQDQIQDLYC